MQARILSSEIFLFRDADAVRLTEGNIRYSDMCEVYLNPAMS